MEADSMELKVISCKDLKAFNFFQKLNIYVVVSIVNEDDDDSSPSPSPTKNEKKKRQQQKQKTPIDREGDGNPEWNHVMQFDLKDIFSSASSHLLQFDLLSEGTILGDKTIGRVRVPFQDLINDFNGGAFRFVSYQVRTTDGIPNGILDFSFKPIFNIHNSSHTNHTFGFVENNNKFGNEFLTNSDLNFNSSFNFNGGGGGGGDVPLIDQPTPSTNCYPPPPPPLAIDGYMNPSTHNPSTESYYPTIDQFDNPSSEIHYPTLQIHSPPSEFHNPSPAATAAAATGEVYYPSPQPQPQPQFDYQLLPSPYHPHHLHHHSHSLPQMAYYPPPPPPPSLFYPPQPPPPTDHHPYGFEFGRGNPNPAAAYGYPNHWPSSTPIHW